MRGCFPLKIVQCVYLFVLIIYIYIYIIRGPYLIFQTPTQMLKIGFSLCSSQEIGSSLVSSRMIFQALRSDLFSFKFHSLRSKILKFPEFNLPIRAKRGQKPDEIITDVEFKYQPITVFPVFFSIISDKTRIFRKSKNVCS